MSEPTDEHVNAAMDKLEAALRPADWTPQKRAADIALRDDLLRGVEEAAKFLGLDKRKVYRLVAAGELPHVHKGRMIFFLKSKLMEAFKSDWTPPAKPPAKPALKREKRSGVAFTKLIGRLSALYDVPIFSSFYSRFMGLRRHGWPLGIKDGSQKGVSSYLNDRQVTDFVLVVELMMNGFGPANAIEICKPHCADFHYHVTAMREVFRLPLPTGSTLEIEARKFAHLLTQDVRGRNAMRQAAIGERA